MSIKNNKFKNPFLFLKKAFKKKNSASGDENSSKFLERFHKFNDKAFGKLQNLSRVIILPVAALPFAGLLLGIGGGFAAAANHYGWPSGVEHFFSVLRGAGSVIFSLLGLIFCIAISFGYAKERKGVAALGGFIAFGVQAAVIHALFFPTAVNGHPGTYTLGFDPWNLGGANHKYDQSTANKGFFSTLLGLTPTIDTSVFGGILIGAAVAWVHNRSYNMRLPKLFAFFGGGRIVPVFSMMVGIVAGVLFFFTWPALLRGFFAIGKGLSSASGLPPTTPGKLTGSNFKPTAAGAFVAFTLQALERILNPTGLHHVLYTPFWFTPIGGTWLYQGKEYAGSYNIFFQQLGSKATGHFNQTVGFAFLSGRFGFMLFGYPFGMLAMYLHAQKQNRAKVGGILLSAGLTSCLTGITEPCLYTYLFIAPMLWGLNIFMAGMSAMLAYIFNITCGQGFAAGAIDFTFFGILPTAIGKQTGWYWMFVIGAVMAPSYFFGFYYIIKWRNYQTLGRSSEISTKGDVLGLVSDALAKGTKKAKPRGQLLYEGLGQKTNILNTTIEDNVLVVAVKSVANINKGQLKLSGSKNVQVKDNTIRVRYLTEIEQYNAELAGYLAGTTKPIVLEKKPVSKKSKKVQKREEALNRARRIFEGLGGMNNVLTLSNCATRLRVTLRDGKKVNREILKETGALGFIGTANNLQVIYGTEVINIKGDMETVQKL